MPEFRASRGGRRLDGDPLPFVLAATGRGTSSKLGLDPSVNRYALTPRSLTALPCLHS